MAADQQLIAGAGKVAQAEAALATSKAVGINAISQAFNQSANELTQVFSERKKKREEADAEFDKVAAEYLENPEIGETAHDYLDALVNGSETIVKDDKGNVVQGRRQSRKALRKGGTEVEGKEGLREKYINGNTKERNKILREIKLVGETYESFSDTRVALATLKRDGNLVIDPTTEDGEMLSSVLNKEAHMIQKADGNVVYQHNGQEYTIAELKRKVEEYTIDTDTKKAANAFISGATAPALTFDGLIDTTSIANKASTVANDADLNTLMNVPLIGSGKGSSIKANLLQIFQELPNQKEGDEDAGVDTEFSSITPEQLEALGIKEEEVDTDDDGSISEEEALFAYENLDDDQKRALAAEFLALTYLQEYDRARTTYINSDAYKRELEKRQVDLEGKKALTAARVARAQKAEEDNDDVTTTSNTSTTTTPAVSETDPNVWGTPDN